MTLYEKPLAQLNWEEVPDNVSVLYNSKMDIVNFAMDVKLLTKGKWKYEGLEIVDEYPEEEETKWGYDWEILERPSPKTHLAK